MQTPDVGVGIVLGILFDILVVVGMWALAHGLSNRKQLGLWVFLVAGSAAAATIISHPIEVLGTQLALAFILIPAIASPTYEIVAIVIRRR